MALPHGSRVWSVLNLSLLWCFSGSINLIFGICKYQNKVTITLEKTPIRLQYVIVVFPDHRHLRFCHNTVRYFVVGINSFKQILIFLFLVTALKINTI